MIDQCSIDRDGHRPGAGPDHIVIRQLARHAARVIPGHQAFQRRPRPLIGPIQHCGYRLAAHLLRHRPARRDRRHHRRLRSGHLQHQFGTFHDGEFTGIADVHRLMNV